MKAAKMIMLPVSLREQIKISVEPISYGNDHSSLKREEESDGTDTWVKVHDISLTFDDKYILEQGEKLTDKHINCAQRILKLKFPSINGLRLTLLQNKAHKNKTTNAIQIFSCE